MGRPPPPGVMALMEAELVKQVTEAEAAMSSGTKRSWAGGGRTEAETLSGSSWIK